MRNFCTMYRRDDAVIGIDPVYYFYRRFRAHIPLKSEQESVVRRALSERTLGDFPYLAQLSEKFEKRADFFIARYLMRAREKDNALAWLALAASYDRRAAGIFAIYLWDCTGRLMQLRAQACLENSSSLGLLENILEDNEKDEYKKWIEHAGDELKTKK